MRSRVFPRLLLLFCAPLAGCGPWKAPDPSDDPYYSFCGSSVLGPDLDEYLGAHGIACLAAGGDLGGTDWVIQGPPETRFRARELVQEQVHRKGWKVSWPADSIILMNQWDQIGFEKGPWIRLASVEHRLTPTQTVLSRLHRAGIPALFLFGETFDFVFVKALDASASTEILRKAPEASVQIHPPRTSVHLSPAFILKETPTSLILVISAAGTGRPLRERVTNATCSYLLPGGKQILGYWMKSQECPDGTLIATYELPPIPSEVDGSVEYSFSFDLDGRTFWHGSPSEPFRVPLR